MNINPIVIFKMPLSLSPCYNQFKYLNTQLQPATPEGKTRKGWRTFHIQSFFQITFLSLFSSSPSSHHRKCPLLTYFLYKYNQVSVKCRIFIFIPIRCITSFFDTTEFPNIMDKWEQILQKGIGIIRLLYKPRIFIFSIQSLI